MAEEHHSLALQRKCLLAWLQCSRESLARKAAQAARFHSQTLCRRVIRSWLQVRPLFICPNSLWHYLTHFCSFPHPQYLTDLEEEMQKLCIHFLQKKIFRAWFNMVREARMDSQSKHKIAAEHSDRWGFDLWGNSLIDFTITLQHILCLEHGWKDEVEAGRAGHSETPGRGGSSSSASDYVGLQIPTFKRRRMQPLCLTDWHKNKTMCNAWHGLMQMYAFFIPWGLRSFEWFSFIL